MTSKEKVRELLDAMGLDKEDRGILMDGFEEAINDLNEKPTAITLKGCHWMVVKSCLRFTLKKLIDGGQFEDVAATTEALRDLEKELDRVQEDVLRGPAEKAREIIKQRVKENARTER